MKNSELSFCSLFLQVCFDIRINSVKKTDWALLFLKNLILKKKTERGEERAKNFDKVNLWTVVSFQRFQGVGSEPTPAHVSTLWFRYLKFRFELYGSCFCYVLLKKKV